jgi:hypothetical protein
VLWLALAARNSGKRPSELAGVDDEIGSLDFDLTCTLRLEVYDFECRKAQAKLIAIEVSKMFGDKSE